MTIAAPLLGQHCVVVGGAGAVGGMFVDLLLGAGASVCVVDTLAPESPDPGDGGEAGRGGEAGWGGEGGEGGERMYAFEQGDIAALDAGVVGELGRADIVVLAVPETVALVAVEGVAAALPSGALLVDTLSVKGPIVAALLAHAAGLEAVSLNPLFAPSAGIDGRAVAAVVVHEGPRGRELLELLEQAGGRVVELDADDHDQSAAATQALTHAVVLAFGLALAELDVEIGELGGVAPPPHTTLLALLARVSSGAPETYWDVQAANPHAPRARAALAGGMRRLADVVEQGDTDAFTAILAELRGVLGDDLDHYRETCADIFRQHEPRSSARTGATP